MSRKKSLSKPIIWLVNRFPFSISRDIASEPFLNNTQVVSHETPADHAIDLSDTSSSATTLRKPPLPSDCCSRFTVSSALNSTIPKSLVPKGIYRPQSMGHNFTESSPAPYTPYIPKYVDSTGWFHWVPDTPIEKIKLVRSLHNILLIYLIVKMVHVRCQWLLVSNCEFMTISQADGELPFCYILDSIRSYEIPIQRSLSSLHCWPFGRWVIELTELCLPLAFSLDGCEGYCRPRWHLSNWWRGMGES